MRTATITSIRTTEKGLQVSTSLGYNVWIKTETAAKHKDRLVDGGQINIQEMTMENGNTIWILAADQTPVDAKAIARARMESDLAFQEKLAQAQALAAAWSKSRVGAPAEVANETFNIVN